VRHWSPVRRAAASLPNVLQVAGVVVAAVGFGLLATWAGLVVGGVGLVAVGTVAELGQQHGQVR
jgi:hypothetical protein